MQATSNAFRANARVGLANPTLQSALGKMKVGFPTKRAEAVAKLPEFDALRDQARDIKNHVLENIDWYLERFEQRFANRRAKYIKRDLFQTFTCRPPPAARCVAARALCSAAVTSPHARRRNRTS